MGRHMEPSRRYARSIRKGGVMNDNWFKFFYQICVYGLALLGLAFLLTGCSAPAKFLVDCTLQPTNCN